ncbi:TetR/AcrR family transcriptional regulator [Streptomyces sp. URMC 123]|uniref:TetR/AcrR family transcriptional regulator n=1 Tax=Streptomyces sp. URMC 123 TaxID=3423403 RepID=UPI003F1D1288
MPRHVDYDSRRRQIVAAAFALVSEHGLEAMTLRDVAARAGVSLGAVQRCFSSKEELMISVVEDMNQRVSTRIQDTIAQAADPGAAITMLHHTLAGVLPHDEPTLAESRVWLAFTAQAAVNPTLAAAQRTHHQGLADLITLLLRTAQATGDIRPDVDPRHEADTLIALTDGLNTHVVTGHHTPHTAQLALKRQLATLQTRKDNKDDTYDV